MNGVVELSPALPITAIIAFASIGIVISGIVMLRSGSGAVWRASVTLAISVMLLNPKIINEQREPQSDVVTVIVDRTASQEVGDRSAQTDMAVNHIRSRLKKLNDLEVREVNIADVLADPAEGNSGGSLLLSALRLTIGGIPKKRIAGAIVISDGQVHDPDLVANLKEVGAPIHFLLTGQPDEIDRRLVIEKAPAYGLVGKEAKITYRIEDKIGPTGGGLSHLARVAFREGDRVLETAQIAVGRTSAFTVPVTHAGPMVLTLDVEPIPGELSTANNRALVSINGVRERLRVLLVSGQPHAGERVWRNLLKSDPAVDLVHFTILRPPEKDDFTPLNEIALIAFPTRELFEEKIKEFDMVVFDRYVVRDVLPPSYLRNIISYVREGGALLLSVGPEFASERSLFNTPLGEVLPVAPTGNVVEFGFRPKVTEVGERHPVTALLPEVRASRTNQGTAEWGRWFRQIETASRAGHTLMEGLGGRPLLVLDRVGRGRVATILSDHIWLWARGFEGGGPHADLMRRLAHWLMKEPDLEEEQLRVQVRKGQLNIARRSLRDAPANISVTTPMGTMEAYPAITSKMGVANLVVPANKTGLYRVSDGEREALAVAGPLNPLEFADLRATPEYLAPLADATGGSIQWVRDGLPDLRKVRRDRDRSGIGWLGLIENKTYIVTGVNEFPLVPPVLFIIGVLLLLMGTWWREGRERWT